MFNYLFAKRHGGVNILRIEDTDQTRFVEGAEQFIIDSLEWCGVTFDEGVHMGGPHGPYRQSERKEMYRAYAERLLQSGDAYYAFDSPEDLDAMRERVAAQGIPNPQYNAVTRATMVNSLTLPAEEVERRLAEGEPYVIRFKIPRKEEVRLHDEIRGWVQVSTSQLDDKVLFKSDGMPTYHLANVVDDYLMEITHVIRGEEWLPSAPLHVLLYKAFAWEDVMPKFAHLPLLLKPDGNGKLSKRDGDKLGIPFYAIAWTNPETGETTEGYRERGFLAEAYRNFLAMMGWNPGTPQELFTMEELIETFSLERVNKHGARYDYDKLKWYNGQYLHHLADDLIAERVMPGLIAKGWEADVNYVTKVAGMIKERLHILEEFYTEAAYFFEEPSAFDEKVLAKRNTAQAAESLQAIAKSWAGLSDWSAANVQAAFEAALAVTGQKSGEVVQLLRVSLSGVAGGPIIWEMCELLGQERCVSRLDSFLTNHPPMA